MAEGAGGESRRRSRERAERAGEGPSERGTERARDRAGRDVRRAVEMRAAKWRTCAMNQQMKKYRRRCEKTKREQIKTVPRDRRTNDSQLRVLVDVEEASPAARACRREENRGARVARVEEEGRGCGLCVSRASRHNTEMRLKSGSGPRRWF